MFKIVDVVECDGRTWEEPASPNTYQSIHLALAIATKAAIANPYRSIHVMGTDNGICMVVNGGGKVFICGLVPELTYIEKLESIYTDDIPF